MDYKNSDLPWCANCIYGVPEENGNNIYCKQIEGWRIEDDFCGLHEWRNTMIRWIVERKGNMDKLIICETDKGRYAVRPMNWAGIWNEKGQIKESLNHLALFIEKEDAEKFVEWKEAEEQGKLLKLPVAVGDTVYTLNPLMNGKTVVGETTADAFMCALGMLEGRFGKTIFMSLEEAEAALEKLERSKEEIE